MSQLGQPARDLDLAIACRAAGDTTGAVRHYHAAARGFLDAGKVHNAIAIYESLLGLVPDDAVASQMLGRLQPEHTPLPPPLPHHVAEPTARLRKTDPSEVHIPRSEAKTPELGVRTLDNVITPPAFSSDDAVDTPYDFSGELELGRSLDAFERLSGPGAVTGEQMILGGPVFAGIPAERRAEVLSRCQRAIVPADTVVIRRGEVDHPLVMIGRGTIALRVERPDGRLVTLFEVGAGEHVGEGAVLGRHAAPVHAIATSECELWLWAPADVFQIAGTYPAVWSRLKDVASRRSREFPVLGS